MLLEGLISFNQDLFPLALKNEEIENNIFFNSRAYIKLKLDFKFEWLQYIIYKKGDAADEKPLSSYFHSKEELSGFNYFSNTFSSGSLDRLGIGVWYDDINNSIHLYRDIFGRVPLYYIHVANNFIAFSNSLPSLLSNSRIIPFLSVNIDKIKAYSNFAADSGSDYSDETFYTNIRTALPGHITSFASNSVTTKSNIKFDSTKWANVKDLKEYGKIFHELFQKSVLSSVPDEPSLIASHLSGGLDSSSIGAMFKTIFPTSDLYTLFAVTDNPASEIDYAHLVSEEIGSIHHDLTLSSDFLSMLYLHISRYGHPECMVLGGFLQASLMRDAKNLGCDAILIGHDGDAIVGSGIGYLNELFSQRDWASLKPLLQQRSLHLVFNSLLGKKKALSNHQKYSRFTNSFIYTCMARLFCKMSPIEFFDLFFNVWKAFDISISYFLKRGLKTLANKFISNDKVFPNLLNKDLTSPIRNTPPHKFSTLLQHKDHKWADGVYTIQAITANEELYTLGKLYGISSRLPFYDKDLYEFCLSVPAIIKFDKGRGRGHLREGMKGILPEGVRTRTSKGNFVEYTNEIALGCYEQAKDLLVESNEVWTYIDRTKFNIAVKQLTKNQSNYNSNSLLVLRAISLAVWLDILKKDAFIT